MQGNLEFYHFLVYGMADTKREDGAIPLTDRYNGTKIVIKIDLAMLGVDSTYTFKNSGDVTERIGCLLIIVLPFLLLVQSCDSLIFFKSFGKVMKEQYQMQRRTSMINLLHRMWKQILKTRW